MFQMNFSSIRDDKLFFNKRSLRPDYGRRLGCYQFSVNNFHIADLWPSNYCADLRQGYELYNHIETIGRMMMRTLKNMMVNMTLERFTTISMRTFKKGCFE